MWQKPLNPFAVTRFGRPIGDVRIKDAKDPHINHSIKFAEYEACVAAGLDLWQWVNRKYPKQFMADVVAWYQLHGLVDSHRQDAARPKK